MTNKQLSLTATISVLFFLALNGWSAQQEINFYEETQRRLLAETNASASVDQQLQANLTAP